MNIAKFSVKNPVLVNILLFTLLAAGAASVIRLPKEQFSEVPFFFVNIVVPYPGVSAEDIEQSVTVKIENELSGIDRLKALRSVTGEGLASITVEFDDGISNREFDRLFQDVRNRLSNVELPEGTLQATVDDFSSNDFLPVIEVVLSGDLPYDELNTQARALRDRFLQVPEVSGVDLVGARDRRIVVDVAQDRLEALNIPLEEVVRAIRARNVTIPGGSLVTPDREYLLRTLGEVSDAPDFGPVIIRTASPGQSGIVRVRDVATVKEDFDPEGIAARFNGRQAVILRVNKIPRGNSVAVIEGVKALAGELRSGGPRNLDIAFFNDSTVQIRDSIDVLVSNALWGFVLLVVILFLFIGLRNAVMVAAGIPLTFAITFVVLELMGETLNSNTLFGLVLVLGLIVDHAIVIVENSYRVSQEGLSRREAAVRGTGEVLVPVLAAAATTVAAFLPLTLLPGVIGKFLRVVPLTVSIALLASVFESAFFLPSHFADWPGGRKKASSGWFDGFQRVFSRFAGTLYRHRLLTVLGMVALAAGTFSLVPRIGQDLFSAEDYSLFYIELELPPGSPQSKTERLVQEYERRILPSIGDGEVVSLISSIGFSQQGTVATRKSSVAQLIVDLTEKDEGRTRGIPEIMADYRTRTSGIPGAERVRFRRAVNGPPQDPPVSFRFFGDNYSELEAVATAVKNRLAGYPELFDIKDNLEAGTPELRIVVNQDRAAALGLSAQSVGAFLRSSFEGTTATTVFAGNEELDVLVRYAGMDPAAVEKILQLKIPAPDGRLIPFSSVARIVEGDAYAAIKRLDGKREVTVTAEAYATENLRQINGDIGTLFSGDLGSRYPGVRLGVGGEFAELANLIFEILRVFLIGVFLIYLILGTQFKSYSQPFLILLSVPFAFVGVILYLAVSGTPLSTTVIYAGVALAGIAVNDTIVLISFINDRRRAGAATSEAVLESVRVRLRPILLTSLTTIAGLLPTAVGLGGRSVIWGPMASTIIFGLLFSTVTALLVVPSLYGLLYDRRGKKAFAVDKRGGE